MLPVTIVNTGDAMAVVTAKRVTNKPVLPISTWKSRAMKGSRPTTTNSVETIVKELSSKSPSAIVGLLIFLVILVQFKGDFMNAANILYDPKEHIL
jgi:hypothetical protein